MSQKPSPNDLTAPLYKEDEGHRFLDRKQNVQSQMRT